MRTNIWKYSVSFNDKLCKHPAVFPEELARDCILSWSVEGDLVLDPFMGSGTTAKMAMLTNRNYIGFELNQEYYQGSIKRLEYYQNNKTINIDDNTIDINGEDIDCIVIDDENNKDKVIEEKTKLFNNLVEQLNEYFNEQSLSTLKTLTLTFKDKR